MKPDEYYLEARNGALEAAGSLDRDHASFSGPEGVALHINRRPPLRVFLLIVTRSVPGDQGITSFNFQRDGRVGLTGNRKVPLPEAIAQGHEAWASRGELLELATQLKAAVPA